LLAGVIKDSISQENPKDKLNRMKLIVFRLKLTRLRLKLKKIMMKLKASKSRSKKKRGLISKIKRKLPVLRIKLEA
jgi:hypothetical protein